MSWFPLGPDFVSAFFNPNFLRLSRRNELGRACMISNIAIDPTDKTKIYVVMQPASGGFTAFRGDGTLWIPIADSLQQGDPNIDPSCITVNPDNPSIIYMGTWDKEIVYVSNSRGDPGSWTAGNAIGGRVRKLIVDRRTASNPSATVLYAATDTGVYRSPDGGMQWKNVLSGDVWSLAAYIPTNGDMAQFYSGVRQQGLFHATDDPTDQAQWTNLSDGTHLPQYSGPTTSEPHGNFDVILVDFCPQQPDRVYALMTQTSCDSSGKHCQYIIWRLYTTSSTSPWAPVPFSSSSPPPPTDQGTYSLVCAVSPNSPGNGTGDILFLGLLTVSRSTDGGQTWHTEPNDVGFHGDQHAFAFFPDPSAYYPGGTATASRVPQLYIGCDGGIAMSDGYADPTFVIDPPSTSPVYNDEGTSYTDSGLCQNYNHGLQSIAPYAYASDPTISTLGYLACQDTCIQAGSGALADWRSFCYGDASTVAIAPGPDGVTIWNNYGWNIIAVWTDNGTYQLAHESTALLGANGPALTPTSNLVAGLDKQCLAGTTVLASNGTLKAAITRTGSQAATPTTLANITTGSVLIIDSGANQETVTVTATTATTFTAVFTKTHAVGATIQIQQAFVACIGPDGTATQISQDFGQNGTSVFLVAASPVDPDILYCVTRDQNLDQNLWMTNSGSTAGPNTVWTEITRNRPLLLGNSSAISSIAIDKANSVYVLLAQPVTTIIGIEKAGGKGFTITSPFFLIEAASSPTNLLWTHLPCSQLPTGNYADGVTPIPFGKLVTDPVQMNTLYAVLGAYVYQLMLSSEGVANWQDISNGLPGSWIYDLWIGNIGSSESSKVLLRAVTATRGIWESDVTAGAIDAPLLLYVRDHLLDPGWLNSSPDGVPNPYDPTLTLWHSECADIKIDAQQPGTARTSPFYQTNPEGDTLPLSHVLFDQLRDNSQNLLDVDKANVHVQVHNRSNTATDNVSVWAIYCDAAAGVPALNVSPSMSNNFNFWGQFSMIGAISPNLPSDSPWKSLGPPQILSGIQADSPQVASWNDWSVPLLPSGDRGHYCMVVFIHSKDSPINETSMDVDFMTPRNRQVGQKNLHIGVPLSPSPLLKDMGAALMEEYVQFHNPMSSTREASLVFDLRYLPPQLSVSLRLSLLDTVNPLEKSMTGIARQMQGERRFGVNPTIYEASPSALVEVREVRIPAFGSCTALLSIRNSGILEEGSAYRFQVQQQVSGQVVGVSSYVVRIAGEKELLRRSVKSRLGVQNEQCYT